MNWSYVLKYLLSTNSKLRQDLRREQSVYLSSDGKLNSGIMKRDENDTGDTADREGSDADLKNKFLLATIQYRERARLAQEAADGGGIYSSSTSPSIPRWNANDVIMQKANSKTESEVEYDAASRIQEVYRKRFTNVDKPDKKGQLRVLWPPGNRTKKVL